MKTKITFLLFALISYLGYSQIEVADKSFKNYDYSKAIDFYKKSLKKSDSSLHVLTRLGDCYYNNSNSEDAVIWYGKAVNKYPDIDYHYIYKYVHTLQSLDRYDEAKIWTKKLNQIRQGKDKYDEFDVTKSTQLFDKGIIDIEVKNLPINTKNADFGGYIYGNKFMFSSSRAVEGFTKNYTWNDEPYLNIFEGSFSKTDGELHIEDVRILSGDKINTAFHDADVAITADGKTMYFSRENLNKRDKPSFNRKGTAHIKIYKATWSKGGWDNIVELPLNSDHFSTGNPALSPDDKTLFFVSDREGGFGETDVYSVKILDDNTFSSPVNLGEKVNTEGREQYPFVSKENILYFSSDGYINFGLLDVYKSNILNDTTAETQNMGTPINSGYDDFAFYICKNNSSGFFSSNRLEGQGGDDIYSFNIEETVIVCEEVVKGIVSDKKTKQPISGATIQIYSPSGELVGNLDTKIDGSYSFVLDCIKGKYQVIANKPDYREVSKYVETSAKHKMEYIADLVLEPLLSDDEIVLRSIYFDLDKSNIRQDAATELEHIVQVLNNHPTMIINIESHTDSRHSNVYNIKLSKRRAESTLHYLISRGLSANRFESARGYGESFLVNDCSDGVPCSETEHQKNRRSKFIIVKR